MTRPDIVNILAKILPNRIAADLVDNYVEIRRDLATRTLGRTASGKFVETVVQALQHLDSGKHDPKPNVDAFLRTFDSSASALDEGIRVCASRIARGVYTLRNKRNIAHKGDVDPNVYDLIFIHAAAQWILAEFVRYAAKGSMKEAGEAIESILVPVSAVVEEIAGRTLVLGNRGCKEEMLIFLHSRYPEMTPRGEVIASLDRHSPGTVTNVLRTLWKQKWIDGNPKVGYKLTQHGFAEAEVLLRDSAS